MTCTRVGDAIICTNPFGRLHVGSRYVWVDFHPYCGPTFFRDRAMTLVYEPRGMRDPVWREPTEWRGKYEQRMAKARKLREHQKRLDALKRREAA